LTNGERQAKQGEQRKARQGTEHEAFELYKRAEPDSSNGSGEEREAARGSDRGEQSADGANAVKKSQKTFHACKICESAR
jgi:hypothetical protein